jgi:hypothetical protein
MAKENTYLLTFHLVEQLMKHSLFERVPVYCPAEIDVDGLVVYTKSWQTLVNKRDKINSRLFQCKDLDQPVHCIYPPAGLSLCLSVVDQRHR